MWFWRRHRQLPASILLPSLDRLSELIEGVVARLDQVALEHEPAPPAPEPDVAPAPVQAGHVLVVSAPDGYRLLQRDGPPPDRSAALALEGGAFLVLRLGPSPLPGDRRRCAFLGREAAPSRELRAIGIRSRGFRSCAIRRRGRNPPARREPPTSERGEPDRRHARGRPRRPRAGRAGTSALVPERRGADRGDAGSAAGKPAGEGCRTAPERAPRPLQAALSGSIRWGREPLHALLPPRLGW